MVAGSYYRFVVIQDYTVGYEGYCDPYSETCFEYCEDEACTEPFHYSWIERHAGTLFNMCGELVPECDAAYECIDDATCSISFCDPAADECEDLSESDRPAELLTDENL